MKYFLLINLLLTAPVMAIVSKDNGEKVSIKHQEVRSRELKSWYDEGRAMTVIDARSKPYFDGNLLPNAKWIPADAPEGQISSSLPNKEALIVVYCANPECPASGWLADKLHQLGYTNVVEYSEGIQGWTQNRYPTVKQGRS